jgi:tetraacyldisaccharide 4'-kinase
MKLARFLLFPIAVVYDGVTTVRNTFFDVNIFSKKVPFCIIFWPGWGETQEKPQKEPFQKSKTSRIIEKT